MRNSNKLCNIAIALVITIILNTLVLIEGVLRIPTVNSNAYIQIFISCFSVVILTLVFKCSTKIIITGQFIALIIYIVYDVLANFGGFSLIIGFIVMLPTIAFTLCWKLAMYVYAKNRKVE